MRYIHKLREGIAKPKLQVIREPPVDGQQQGMVVRVIALSIQENVVVAGEGAEEVVRQPGILGQEVRSVGNRIDAKCLRDMLAQNPQIGRVHHDGVSDILLYSEGEVVVVGRLILDIKALRVTG